MLSALVAPMDAESYPVMPDKTASNTLSYHCINCGNRTYSHRSRFISWILGLAVHVSISVSLVVVLLHVPRITNKLSNFAVPCPNERLQQTYSPLNGTIPYHTVFPDSDAWKESLYTGHPSHKSDAAWKELQKVRGVWISRNEASRLKISSGLSAGNDTKATLLGVQHNLHCVRFVRQILFPEYYYPTQTVEGRGQKVEHASHCLEALRQSIMCVPDLTPRSVYWEDEERSNIAVNPSVKQECVDWRLLDRWMGTRAYTLNDLWEANPPKP